MAEFRKLPFRDFRKIATTLGFTFGAFWVTVAIGAPTLRILDTTDTIQLILPDGTNSGAVSKRLFDDNNHPYEFLQYRYMLPAQLKPVPPGAASANSREYFLTEPGSGTDPGTWSDTLDVAWFVDSSGADDLPPGVDPTTSSVLITFYSDGGYGRPDLTSSGGGIGGVFAGSVEENSTFAVTQDFDLGAAPFLYVAVKSVPEPPTFILVALCALGFTYRKYMVGGPNAAKVAWDSRFFNRS